MSNAQCAVPKNVLHDFIIPHIVSSNEIIKSLVFVLKRIRRLIMHLVNILQYSTVRCANGVAFSLCGHQILVKFDYKRTASHICTYEVDSEDLRNAEYVNYP